MTTTTDKLAEALRALLTRAEADGTESVFVDDARAALAEHEAGKAAPAPFTDAEVSTLLAALRYWQFRMTGESPGDDFDDIANRGGTLVPLDDYAIDGLCERINE